MNKVEGVLEQLGYKLENYVPRIIAVQREKIRADGSKVITTKNRNSFPSLLPNNVAELMKRNPHQIHKRLPNPHQISYKKHPRPAKRGSHKVPYKVLSKEAVALLKEGRKNEIMDGFGRIKREFTVVRFKDMTRSFVKHRRK